MVNTNMYNSSSNSSSRGGDVGKPVEVTHSIGKCHYCGKPIHVTVRALVKLDACVYQPDGAEVGEDEDAPINSAELSVEPRIVERGIKYTHDCMPTAPTMFRGTTRPRSIRMFDDTNDSGVDGDTDL